MARATGSTHCTPEGLSGELKGGACRRTRLRGQVHKHCLIGRYATCAFICPINKTCCVPCCMQHPCMSANLRAAKAPGRTNLQQQCMLCMLSASVTSPTCRKRLHHRLKPAQACRPGTRLHWSQSQRRCSSPRLRLRAWLTGQSRQNWCRTGRGRRGTALAPAGRHRSAFGRHGLWMELVSLPDLACPQKSMQRCHHASMQRYD